MELNLLGTEENLRAIIERHKDSVYKVAYSYCRNSVDSDDIFQEVFLSYFRSKPQFESAEHEKAWFIRVTINYCKKMMNSSWKKKIVELQDNIIFETKEDSDLYIAVANLPHKYRIVVHLYYYEGYSIKEISQIISVKETTIQTRLQRARGMLKKFVEEEKCYEYRTV